MDEGGDVQYSAPDLGDELDYYPEPEEQAPMPTGCDAGDATEMAPSSMQTNGKKKLPQASLQAGDHEAKNLYFYTNNSGNEAGRYNNNTFIRVPSRRETGSELFPYSHLDAPSRMVIRQIRGNKEQHQVRVTNVAHHTRVVPTCVDFEFTIREILERLGAQPAIVRTTTHTEVCAFHPGAAMIPLEHAFDLGAARMAADEEASSSGESDRERKDKDRVFSRFVYSPKVDVDVAGSAILQAGVPGVSMGKVLFTKVCLRACETQFPVQLKLQMTGVKPNFHAKHGPCAALVSPTGVMTALDGGALLIVPHTCQDAELASFMDMDPEREISHVLVHGADASRVGRYHLTSKLMIFVELCLIKRFTTRLGSKELAIEKLGKVGVTVLASDTMLIMHATNTGLLYILQAARELRQKMPIFNPNDVMVSIEPNIAGGWRGIPDLLARRPGMFGKHEDLDFLDIPFQVSVHLDMTIVPPDAQHERVEAFAQIVSGYQKRCAEEAARMASPAPTVMVVNGGVPSAPVLSPEILALQARDPLAAQILMARVSASASATAKTSSQSKRSSPKKSNRRRA